MLLYNAEGKILGRLCSVVAKKLLEGESVVVVNCEKCVVSGEPKMKLEEYLEKRQRGSPAKGPFFPKYPDQIFRRTVRGMLPWKKAKGKKAFKRLKVFIGLPKEYQNKKSEEVREADASKLRCKSLTLEELCLQLGAKKRW